MAYCMSCGAYIPDGQTKCLACGFEDAAKARENKKKAGASAGAQAYSFDNEELKEKLEQQREQQKENSRKWAEQEYARRQQQENSRKWAEEEYRRRQQEREREAQSYVNRPSSSASAGTGTGTAAGTGTGNKALAALSYVSVLFALPFVFTPEDEFAKYHAKQGMRLFIFGIIADALSWFPVIGWLLPIARLYFMVKGIMNVVNGVKEPLPYIGTIGAENNN